MLGLVTRTENRRNSHAGYEHCIQSVPLVCQNECVYCWKSGGKPQAATISTQAALSDARVPVKHKAGI